MAITEIQDNGTITAGNTTSLTPSVGEEWFITLIVSQDTLHIDNRVSFNNKLVYGYRALSDTYVNPSFVSEHHLTNTNDLTIGATQTDVNYYYSGYKKT